MSKRDVISRFIPECRSFERAVFDDEFDYGWYLALAHVFLLIVEQGAGNRDLLRHVSEFIEWALTQDEELSSAATIELLEPLLYAQYGPVGSLLESELGKGATEFLARVR